jgi:predicted Zn-dependent peptidase
MDIKFERFTLKNGLRVIFHEDSATPMIAFNVLYDVGARDEDPAHTGFAHLFEHLMFGGSVHIPEYDGPLQRAGGENNAYTTNDITNYYIQVPKENMETAFWLESDRMSSLAFSQESLDVQKKVVMEEFKEHYISKPYGDVWHHLRALAYKKHPYQWLTIGKNLEQIEQVTLEEVKAFFHKHYRPQNAVICVAGNTSLKEVRALAEKWFGDIPGSEKQQRQLPQEPRQTAPRQQTVEADVPVDAIYKAWHIGDRLSDQYYAVDLLTEILGNGKSSRFYDRLVKERQLFSAIECYHTGSLDPGLLVIEGKLVNGVSMEQADEAIEKELEALLKAGLTEQEIEKAKNKTEAQITFEDMHLLSRANNLAFYELLGDAGMMNEELERYQNINIAALEKEALAIFDKNNCSTLFYKAKNVTG